MTLVKMQIPRGYVWRKGHTRTLKNGETIRIKGKIVKSSSKKVKIGPVMKGTLTQYGYSMSLPATERRIALKKAIKNIGSTPVLRKVNLISIWNKNKNPKLAAKAKADVKWIQKNYPSLTKKKIPVKTSGNKRRIIKCGSKILKFKNKPSKEVVLYHIENSNKKFYKYRKTDGTYGKRYV